jgi:hypothetical protein
VPPVGVLPLSIYLARRFRMSQRYRPGGGVSVLTNCCPGETVEAPYANATGDDTRQQGSAHGGAPFCFLYA